jgi:anaerobic selenocysteine-containing dehydrogenase
MINFFCSKDCPDLCGVRIQPDGASYSFHGLPEKWSDPGFVCAKFKSFMEREINNGQSSWHLVDGKRQHLASDNKAIEALATFLEPFRKKKVLYLRGSGSLAYNMSCWDLLFAGFADCWTVSGGPCDATGSDADEADFGALINPEITNLELADTIILYGKNARTTSQHLYAYLKTLKKQGKEIIYLDPVKTKTAELADRYIRINPACDGLLACALLTGLGYENGYDIETLLTRAGVSREEYEYLLTCLRKGKTAHIKGFSIQRYDNGMNAYRWINRLAVMTGNINLLYFGHPSKRHWEKPGAVFAGRIPVEKIPEVLAQKEFDLYVNVAANPAMTYPDSNLWDKGLSRTSTLVIDTNHSRTAEHADFFLKVGGMFSQNDFMGSYFFSQEYSRDKLTSELSDMDAARMLAGTFDIDLPLKEQAQVGRLQDPQREYHSEPLALILPEMSDKFQLLTSSHQSYINSQVLPGMEEGLQIIHINTADANSLGIKNGEDVRVSGAVGEFVAEAFVTDDITPKTVMCWKNIPMKKGNTNCAIPNKVTDSGSGLAYYSAFVDLQKI